MNRVDWYFGQIVTQGDMDEAFDYVEQASLDHRVDTGLLGIVDGLAVTAQAVPNMTVNVAAGVGYDQLGQRVRVGGTQVVNLAGSAPAGGGASRVVSVCVRFDRDLSDPRVDDNSVTVQYQRAESFEIFLVAGAEVVGTPTPPSKPSDGLVLADVTLTQGDVTIATGDINMTATGRRDWAFDIAIGTLPTLQVGTLTEVVTSNRQILNDHINDLTVPHSASSIGYTDPGSGSAATNVEAALDALIAGSTIFQLGNTGGYTFGATGDVLFSGEVTFEDVLNIEGNTDAFGASWDWTDGRGGSIVATGQPNYQTNVYQFAAAAITGAGGFDIAMSDNRVALVTALIVASDDANASVCYARDVSARCYRNGGTVNNSTVRTDVQDDTGAVFSSNGIIASGNNIRVHYNAGAGTYNVSAYVTVTYAPE